MTLDPISLKQDPTYRAEAPIQRILSDLHQIASLDQEIEHKQRRITLVMVGCIVGAIALFILLLVLANPALTPLLLVALLLAIGGAIGFGILRSRYAHINIPNYRYELLVKLLNMVMRDMDQHAFVTTHLVLSPPQRKEKCIADGPHPHRQGWNQKRYADQWLTLRGSLLDHTQFQLQCTELWVTSSGWKRGRSGKMKHKTKSKPKGFDLCLCLRVPRKKYGALPVLAPAAQGAVRLPPGCLLKELDVEDNELSLRVRLQPPPPETSAQAHELYQTITLMFLSTYHILNLARELSKPKAKT